MATERSVLVRLGLDPKGFIAGARAAGAAVQGLRKDIDTTNDRTAWLAQSFLALGPSLAPIGAAAVPALAGLATQLLATGLAAGTLTLAFNGVGDGLKALNDFQIEPSEAHLKKLRETMDKIGPSGRDMVLVLDEMGDGLSDLANLSRDKMFPGVLDGLDEIRSLAPQVEKIISRTSHALGDLASSAGEGLAGPRFAEFFDFLKTDAVTTLKQLGQTIGNVADGLAAMLVAFAPLSSGFTGGMLEMSKSFADWAHGLEENESFQSFVDYIQANTPNVLALLGQLVDTFVQIAEAAAPVGAVMLPLFTGLLKLIEAIADSPLGPIFIAAAAAMSLYGRAVALASISTAGLGKQVGNLGLGLGGLRREFNSSLTVMGKHRAALASDAVAVGRHAKGYQAAATSGTSAIGRWSKALAPAGVTAGAFALAMSPIPEKLGLTNTAMGAMTGSLLGPWGAAVGAGVGLLLDLSEGTEAAVVSAEDLVDAINLQTMALTAQGYAGVGEALASLADEADLVGVSLSDVVTAAVEGGPAMDALVAQINAAKAADTTWAEGMNGTTVPTLGKTANAALDLLAAIGGQNDEVEESIRLALGRKAGLEAGAQADRDATGGARDLGFALDDLTAITDVNSDGILNNTDVILGNIEALDARTDRINAAFDAETAFQRSLQLGADREKAAAALREQIGDAQADGAEDRGELLRRLAEARAALARAKTPSARQGASDSIASIQGQIADSNERQADTIARLREELALYAPTLDKTTKAGQENRDVLSDMAAGWNDLSDKQQNAKGKFETARKALVDQAMQFGATRRQAEEYADRLLEIPPKVATKLLLDKQKAQADLKAFSDAFHGLDGDVARVIVKVRGAHMLDRLDRLGGSYAEGGFTGQGGKHEPAGIVHRGEFVVPAPYAERDRAMLEKAYLPGYANGGYVAASAQPGQAALGIDYDRLAMAMANQRQLYGDVHVNGDPTVWRKQMEDDARARGAGKL